ncbi:MAG: hypothetical protein JWP16_1153, partial [Alphaproteobacteria bacterium]|nr:hypothetical protein [Alphaproteobacteria bacterium]
IARMATIVRAWLYLMTNAPTRDPANTSLADSARAGGDKAKALDNPALFPHPFREDIHLRAAVLNG